MALETPLLPFMANTILDFHFDYLHTSLSIWIDGQKSQLHQNYNIMEYEWKTPRKRHDRCAKNWPR